MKSLRDLINKKKTTGPLNLDDQTVFYVFRKVVKEEFGNVGVEKFASDYFGKGVLVVKSESSVWASELWLNRDKIIRLINKELGSDAVKKIRTK